MNDRNKNIRSMFALFCVLLALVVLYLSKYILIDSKEIINNPYNPRLRLMEETVRRGQIIDSAGVVLADSTSGEREYPYGRQLAHLVGSVQMGKSGVEARYNILLQSPSMEIIQRFKNLPGDGKVTGDTAMLTIDASIQEIVYSAFGQNRGAAVVMEPSTGRILAMVSRPNFDPARVADNWGELIGDTASSPLLNRATQGLYPPGSVFKPLTAAAAIENGLADFIYECSGIATFGGDTLRCFNSRVHGTVDMLQAMAVSCNGYFAAAALEIGVEALHEACERAFFNQDLSYQIERGRSSFTLSPDASVIDIARTSIGQGQTLVTPLHMCMVTSAIANNGRMMKPYVLGRQVSATGAYRSLTLPEVLGQAFSGEVAAALTEMMIEAVGTGSAAPAAVAGVSIAAKTGTAQNASGDDHGWVTAFAPADGQPQIAIAVVMENAGGPRLGLELVKKVVEGAVKPVSE